MRGDETMRASFGLAIGMRITSMRKRAVFGSSIPASRQPGSSLGDRTLDDPEMYTYTLALSFGSVTTVCVCDPRQVCTFATYFGFTMSVASKMRRPRMRSSLTESGTPCVPQSIRPPCASAETKRMFLYTDTSLCEAGQRYDDTSLGRDGLAMSQTM
jgi:hypothetical protein